jgi:hypothetical protein
MFHPNTEKLIAEWRAQRGSRRLPQRTDLSPMQFGGLLPQLFILGRDFQGKELFRLSGGLLADLHGRELRGADFAALWSRPDRGPVEKALEEARKTAQIAVLQADGYTTEGDHLGLEIALAPLIGPTGHPDRTLGLYQPTSATARLMRRPLEYLSFRSAAMAAAPPHAARGHLKLVVLDGRRVA